MEGCLRSLRSLANHPFTEILRISKVPFISSLAPPAPSAGVGALKSFMKYDKKWGGGAKLAASKQVKQWTKPSSSRICFYRTQVSLSDLWV